jgi:hypothetical protein
MAAPNLRDPATVIGKTFGYAVTGTLAQVLANGSNSGKILKINTIRAANVDGAAAFDVDLTFLRGGTHTYLAKTISIPADATVLLVSRDELIYLEEGDALHAKASTAAKVDLTVSYEDIS